MLGCWPYQPPFEVHVTRYNGATETLSRHRSPRAAARSLASIIGGRKYRIRDLSRAVVWCARDNSSNSLERLRERLARGDFEGAWCR